MRVTQIYGGDADYYTILGVSPQDDEETIRQAFRRLARSYHPDVAGDAGAEHMKRINAAYHTLSDPVRRRAYDERRQQSGSYVPPRAPRSGPIHAGPHVMRQRPQPPVSQSDGPLRQTAALDLGERSDIVALAFAQQADSIGVGCDDGRVTTWRMSAQQQIAEMRLRSTQDILHRGMLGQMRLSPSGDYLLAWGMGLVTSVWNTRTGTLLYSSGISAPAGAMDGVVLDQPPLLRLAVPKAPLDIAEDDPFRWVEMGRYATHILTRGLEAAMQSPQGAPMICEEPAMPHTADWRVMFRFLSLDGASLVTFVAGADASRQSPSASIATLWDLRKGAGGRPVPIVNSLSIPGHMLWAPIACDPSGTILAGQFGNSVIRLFHLQRGQYVDVPTGRLPFDTRIALSPDGSLLAITWPEARRCELWSTAQGRRLQEWTLGAPAKAITFGAILGTALLAIGRTDGLCEIWSAS
jgi:WD40 repeat protein